jgi:hypothetical protein
MNKKIISKCLLLIVLLNLQWINVFSSADEKPLIFPIPGDIQIKAGNFSIDKSTFIYLPEKPLKSDIFLGDLLFAEFSDKFEQPVLIKRALVIPANGKYFLMGDLSNPLVKKYCTDNNLLTTLTGLGSEGYILSVTEKGAVVAANTKNGALFGMESLRQIISKNGETLSLPQLVVKDSPRYPFRGIKVYLPGRENITFFKRFIRDFVALYKFNTIILELNANMRLERHPELNVGAVQFERHLSFSRLDRPPGVHKEYQNSSHQDNADGGILEKAEVADLVSYMRQFNIEVIPELPSLTHSYYLLWGRRELAENLAQPYPDTYCPLKPESYKLYFDVLDEYIEVIHPKTIHIGHDEWRMEKDLCDLCRGKDYGELYAMDVIKIHDYLAKKGIKIALWGDHLLESVTEKEFQTWKSSAGYQYNIPGALRPEQVLKLIPKDILVFNWFWDEMSNDKQVSDFGFKQVYGNFRADINDWEKRQNIKGLLGGAPSSWAGTTEKNFGKDQLIDFLGASNLLWSKEYLPFDKLVFIAEPLISSIYYRFRGNFMPGEVGAKVVPVDISANFNSDLSAGIDSIPGNRIAKGKVGTGNIFFNPGKSSGDRCAVIVTTQKVQTRPASVSGIQINKDANSLIFLHACAREGYNRKAYDIICNFDETAELLGWYEVVYDDGYVVTIPVRYGLNILDWNWHDRIGAFENPKYNKYSQNQYAYQAPAVLCSPAGSDPVNFFAFEWVNPRLGKTIKEVNLKSVNFGKNNDNAIILLGLSITENTKDEAAKGTERQ